LANNNINQKIAITGVQKKLSVDFKQEDKKQKRLTIVDALEGKFILKIATEEYTEMPELEHLTMILAKQMGIKTGTHGLIELADNSLAYITKRFDRTAQGQKIAMEDFCQLSELSSENKYKSTYERAGKVIRKYSSFSGNDSLTFFEIIVFSFLVGNSDMHLKNFSLIEVKDNCYQMSPAYDLLSTELLLKDAEECALSINGKKANLKRKDFLDLAKNLKIPAVAAETVLKKFKKKEREIFETIETSILSNVKKHELKKLILEREERIRT
jgi:serine/threonine-protein kinase HipA